MIDTVKIYAEINKDTYETIHFQSIVKSSVNFATGEVHYEIINGHLEGSYDSRLSVRVGCGSKYGFPDLMYCIEIEGSYHKILKGYNSHDGIYNLNFIVNGFIQLAENTYNVKLPSIDKWYLQRLDLAKCFDLCNQNNVVEYLQTLNKCSYPRRTVNTFSYGGINVPGTSSTLKVYNKFLEFKKHDMKKFRETDFKLNDYLRNIQGFIRFEVEIKKKLLLQVFKDTPDKLYFKYKRIHIKVENLDYSYFEKVWCDEFMKLLGMIEKELDIVRGKDLVKKRLLTLYGNSKGMRLFNFYCSIQLNGIDFVKNDMKEATYYRNIKELKDARIDYSQTYKIEMCDFYRFNPFEYEEVV